jgi:hypothetical protein
MRKSCKNRVKNLSSVQCSFNCEAASASDNLSSRRTTNVMNGNFIKPAHFSISSSRQQWPASSVRTRYGSTPKRTLWCRVQSQALFCLVNRRRAITESLFNGVGPGPTCVASNSLTGASNEPKVQIDDSPRDILGVGADWALCIAVCGLLFPYVRRPADHGVLWFHAL